MIPLDAIACACRCATAVNLASVFTAGSPCSRRYCEIMAVMSSARATEAVTTNPNRTQMSLTSHPQPLVREELPLLGQDGNLDRERPLADDWRLSKVNNN